MISRTDAHASQNTPHPIHHMDENELRQCLENCLDCYEVCTQLVPHCLSLGGVHANPAHIGMLLNCASMAQTSAQFMAHKSEFHTETCAVCAKICLKCAEECELIAGEDIMMLGCADVCRRCAESCEKMAGHQH